MSNKEKCFIITPIGDDTDPIRRHIDGIIDAAIRPALGEKYEIEVAHQISEPGSITKQIIREIFSDKLAIANLTSKNPNVMYELAFRHSLGKPVIMIAEKGTPLPSDIIMERTIFYQNDARGVLELKENLIEAEESIDFDKESSPIYDIIREIDREAQIVNLSNEQLTNQLGSENADILQYILQKLNNLQESIQAIRPFSQASEVPSFTERVQFRFKYLENSQSYSKEKLFIKLQKINALEPGIIVEDVHTNTKTKEVRIFTILMSQISISTVRLFFKKTLTEFGFVGAELSPNR